jgi:NTP pyrophosphatase (non-canonical NTP hydrolase)
MKERIFTSLVAANIARDKEWDPDDKIDAAFRGVEHGGEVGEAAAEVAALLHCALAMIDHTAASGRVQNIIKKLERERHGIRGSRSTTEALGTELADDIITAYLIGMHYGIDLDEEIEKKFNATSRKQGLSVILDLTSGRKMDEG